MSRRRNEMERQAWSSVMHCAQGGERVADSAEAWTGREGRAVGAGWREGAAARLHDADEDEREDDRELQQAHDRRRREDEQHEQTDERGRQIEALATASDRVARITRAVAGTVARAALGLGNDAEKEPEVGGAVRLHPADGRLEKQNVSRT